MRERTGKDRLLNLWRRQVALRPLACCCTAFSGAVFVSVYLMAGWQMLLAGGLLLFLGLALVLRQHRLAGAMLTACALGLWVVWLWSWNTADLESHWAGRMEPLTMQAQDYSEPSGSGSSVEAVILTKGRLSGLHISLWMPEGTAQVTPGDEVSAIVTLHAGRGLPGVWQLSGYANGILLRGTARTVQVMPGQAPWHLLPHVAAHKLGNAFSELFDPEEAGFLLALTIGDRSRLTGELTQALSDTGLRHIVAASGLHVTVLVTALFLLPGARKRKSVALVPILVFYAALAGFSPSVCRAVIMELFLLLAPVLEREADSATSLTVALALILLHNPYAAASVSLMLSFSAMLGLLTVTPGLMPPARHDRFAKSGVGTALRSSAAFMVGANFFSLPLVLYCFGSFSGLSPLSNLVIVWMLPFLLPLGMLTGAVGILSPVLAKPLAALTALPVGMVIRLILSLARLPHVTLLRSPVIFAWLLQAQMVILLYCAKLLREGARGLAAALAAAGLILALLPVQEGEIARMELLDVGQGQCILLRSDGETAVIDCGSAQNRAGYLLCRKLTAQRIDCVDHLILTHYDSDHINGFESLLSACPVSHLHLPYPVDEAQETAQRLIRLAGGNADFVPEAGEVLQVGRLRLRLLQAGSGRNGGIVILVTAGAFDLLVTGDADFSGEGELMERMALPDIEVLVAGHHGSATSTGWELLQQTKPESVVISVGENSYGHPAAEMLERCERAGAEVWRTDESGGISILLFEEGAVSK